MKSKIKKIISIILGIAATYFIVYIIYDSFATITIEGILLLLLPYVFIVLFLVFWNIKNGYQVYLLLLIPGIFVFGILGIIIYDEYANYVNNMARVSEYFNISLYEPFGNYSKNFLWLSRLGESGFKIDYPLPVLDGATAFYPIYALFAEAVYPRARYNPYEYNSAVLMSRTPNAYDNLLDGKADIIFCLEPSEIQKDRFERRKLELKLVPIGREAFVFFVNPKNPVNNLTIDDIHGIYSGEIKNWKSVSGKNQSIRAYQRPGNSGSQTILEKIMGDVQIMEPKTETLLEGMDEILNQVAAYKNYKNAIGYSFLFYSAEMVETNQIKLLSIEGVYPSGETIQDNSYPLTENIYAIYVEGNKNENIEPFIEWMLSAQGQELVFRAGYVPVREY
jgi:phosphate transport system substrate-binding protein